MKTNDEILKEIKELTEEDFSSHYDEWGFGQIKISRIINMMKVCEKYDFSLHFVKKVTALDDLSYEYRTIKSYDDSLFVYPIWHKTHENGRPDISDFWNEVDNLSTKGE